MKRRALPILGVAGLALLSVTAPAQASADKVDICHAGKMLTVDFNATALNGHAGHSDDIIAPSEFVPDGLNWDVARGYTQCGATVIPPVDPPADPPVDPPVDPPADPPVDPPADPPVDPPAQQEQPVVQMPAAVTPAGQAAAPQVAVAKVPAAAVSRGTNQGFNAQTAVGGTEDSTTWLAGLGVLLGAGAVVSVRRKSRTESPTAG